MRTIKEAINKNKKLWFTMILVLGFLLVILYFRAFFSYGVYYDNTFLKKEKVLGQVDYTGKNLRGNIKISIEEQSANEGEFEIRYVLGDKINKAYRVSFGKTSYQGQEVLIKDHKGAVSFEGIYERGNMFLLGKNGDVMFPGIGVISGDIDRLEWPNPIAYPHGMIKMITGENEEIRGEFSLLLLAFIIFGITIIDISFPTFFFSIRHGLAVESPEPTDFYKATQKISWVALGFSVIILLVLAVNPHLLNEFR